MLVEQFSNCLRAARQFRRIGRIAMPRKEIERQRLTPAKLEEAGYKGRRDKVFLIKSPGVADCRSTDFQIGVVLFDGRGRGFVESKILLVSPAPHGGAILRLIPNLPILDLMPKSICPTVI